MVLSVLALALSSIALLRTAAGGADDPTTVTTTTDASSATTPEESAPATSSASASAATTGGTTDTSGDDDPFTLPATGDYQLVYERKEVTLNPGASSCVERGVDLDQPLVGTEYGIYDVSYSHCQGRPAPELTFVDKRIASNVSETVTPEDCAQQIGSAPIDIEVTPSQGLTLCAVTNGVGAANQPQRVKIVAIVIDAVGDDGTVNATLSAWSVPR